MLASSLTSQPPRRKLGVVTRDECRLRGETRGRSVVASRHVPLISRVTVVIRDPSQDHFCSSARHFLGERGTRG